MVDDVRAAEDDMDAVQARKPEHALQGPGLICTGRGH
jgi:hypothetical protein